MSDTLLKNALYVNEGRALRGDILIRGAFIERVGASIPAPAGCEVLDCADLLVLPGAIDDQVHFREPGGERKATIASESLAAVAGGVTSFMDMPNNDPPAVTAAALEAKRNLAARSSAANYSFYLGATEDNLGEIVRADPARVCGVKVFMGSSTGTLLVRDDAALRAIFRNSPVLIATHCEDDEIIRRNAEAFRAKYGEENLDPSAHPLIRSREACLRSTEKAVALAQETGADLHVLHLSTAEELELFRPYAGLDPGERRITAEACVHHLFFSDADYARLGNLLKCNPAVKTEADRKALVRAVADGTVTVIGTDHAPHTAEEKSLPYFRAPSGLPLIQFSLPAALELADRGELTVEAVVTAMCHNPAKRFRVDRRGFIREGYYADLAVVARTEPRPVRPGDILSKCGWSPFAGHAFGRRVVHTFVNGRRAVRDGRADPEARFGRELRFLR